MGVAPRQETAEALAVLVCHDGEQWLPEVLAALGRLSVTPRYLIAVDTGSSDRSAELVEAARDGLIDDVLTLPVGTGFGAAVSAAIAHARERWDDPGRWLWLLHDDSAPEPDCLARLVHAASEQSGAAMLGPLGVAWDDPRLLVDVGQSADAAGRVQDGLEPSEVDISVESSGPSEVLSVSSACCLLRLEVFEQLGGFDPYLPLSWDDIDLGWRINVDGHRVLFVPAARMRHAAALRTAKRIPDALPGRRSRAWPTARRVHGVRTFLANASVTSFVLGVPRLLLLALLRMPAFALVLRTPEAAAEGALAWRLISGRLRLMRARNQRRVSIPLRHNVRPLLTTRLTRIRNRFRGMFASLVRARASRDVALGRLPAADSTVVPADTSTPVAPETIPEEVRGKPQRRRTPGLRRMGAPVIVPIAAQAATAAHPSPRPRPSPARRKSELPDLLVMPIDRGRVLRELLLTPPVVLTVALLAFALITNGVLAQHPRLGLGLHGGRLLPAADLADTWSAYLASWHPIGGGTGSPAPVSLLVLAVAGTILAPVGGPSAFVSLLMVGGVPLAGISAYSASRSLPVSRTWRAVVAAVYALVPAAALSASEGRLDVVVTHILLPVLLAGIASVVGLSKLTPMSKPRHWLTVASLTALGLMLLGAFAPLMQAVLLVLAVLGFVLVPARARRSPRRVAGLSVIVLLSVASLLPWPIVLVRHPQILLHGLGARMPETPAGLGLLGLSPSAMPVSLGGAILLFVCLAGLLLARSLTAIPGLLVAGAGAIVAWAVSSVVAEPITGGPGMPGWAGAPLLLVACGLCWAILASIHKGQRGGVSRRIAAVLLAVSLPVLGASSVLAARGGPLTTQADPPIAQAARVGSDVLVINEPGPGPARILPPSGSRFGDDDFVPVDTANDWLLRMDADLLSGNVDRIRPAVAAVAAHGIGFVVLPPGVSTTQLQQSAGDLLGDDGGLPDGRRVLRITLPSTPVKLLGPDLARQARLEPMPGPEAHPLTVPATLPRIAVRVSPGGSGRVLLLAAENEPGWQAVVDGHTVALATAWGHQVAVPLPAPGGEVEVAFTEVPRTTLLVLQVAAILFCLIGALPARRHGKSTMDYPG